MWELMPIEVGSKKLDAQVNMTHAKSIEIEMPFFKSFKATDSVKIGKEIFTIQSWNNLGGRDETISLIIHKEQDNGHKQTESRKNNNNK